MKRTFHPYLLLTLLCLLVAACDSNGSEDDLALGSMEAKVDGKAWQAINATANRLSATGQPTVTITGATLQAEGISFTITDTGTGTYTLDDTFTPAGPDVLSASYTKGPGQTYVATGGSFKITRKDDEAIEGTFSFEAKNTAGQTVSVQSGAFNVGYGVSFGKQ